MTKRNKNKIGIITINDYNNYGNRLQNYALQEILKSIDCEVETITNFNTSNKTLKEKLNDVTLKKIYNKIKFVLDSKINKIISIERNKNFKLFTDNYIKEKKINLNELNLKEFNHNEYDFFVVGSDQVWNPNFRTSAKIDFLTFAPNNKRVSYAASFGISKLDKETEKKYKKALKGFDKISVRETAGAEIIKNLIQKDVPVLVDPTILLTSEEWLKVAKPAKNKPTKKYVVTYFLGGVPEKYKKEIEEFSKTNDFEIINIGDKKDKSMYSAGPSEFVDYISSCEVMFTDSFHGTVFSILFRKPFVIYERLGIESMYSRIDTLLNMFDLKEREYKNITFDKTIFDINYKNISEVLKKERNKSIKFLQESFKSENR